MRSKPFPNGSAMLAMRPYSRICISRSSEAPRPQSRATISVRRGGTLVTARVDDARALTVRQILQRYKSVDPAIRGAAYRENGWTSFDEKAPPYTADQVAA